MAVLQLCYWAHPLLLGRAHLKEPNMKRLSFAAFLLFSVSIARAGGFEEQVQLPDAPEFAGKYFLTIVVSDLRNPTVDERIFLYTTNSGPMVKFREQVVVNTWDNSKQFLQRSDWSAFIGPERPALLLQAPSDATGKAPVVFFAKGDQLMGMMNSLPAHIQRAITTFTTKHQQRPCDGGRCPLRPRPQPQPQPQPQPTPPPTPPAPPAVAPIPPTIEPEAPEPVEDDGIPLWLMALPVISAGAGLWKSFEHSK